MKLPRKISFFSRNIKNNSKVEQAGHLLQKLRMEDFYNKILENARKTLESIVIPQAVFKDLSEIIKRNREAVLKFNKIISGQRNTLIDTVNKINANFPKLSELTKFSQKVAEILKEKKERKKALLESGWWATPSIMQIPATDFSLAFVKYSKGNKRAITDLFISAYQKNNCSYLTHVVENWYGNKYFKPWKKQLSEALKAHKRKEYNTSIPALLLTAEGIAKDFCKANKIVIEKSIQSRGNKKIMLAINSGIDNDSIDDIFSILGIDIFFAAIENRIYMKTELIKNTARGFRHYLNRHAILHGESKNYGTLKNSIQSFMLLDILSLLK